jgi:hypothetical protein
MRALAARDRLPAVYKWIAKEASWEDIVTFLALEGGPDAGFDDLVAACQVGLSGPAKMELATNYWDEMGDGDPDAVHTTLHERLAVAIDMPSLPLAGQPTSALARAALSGLLATNRWLQPEMLGALGLIECQAGPRCRLVLQGFERCGAPTGAYSFYDVHAEVDPRHGKDWLDNAVAPTVAAHPEWSPRIVRGAHWRSVINGEFLADAARLLGVTPDTARESTREYRGGPMRTQVSLLVVTAALLVAGLSGCGANNGNGSSVTTNDVTPGPSVSCGPGTRPGTGTAQTGKDRHGCTIPVTPTTSTIPSSSATTAP